MASITISVNSLEHVVDESPDTPLLWILRDSLELTGTKYGCGVGLCGSCTVHLDGEAVCSCITPITTAADREITTIEGLSATGKHPLQRAWVAERVSQCGYCQAGQIMTAAAFLVKNPNPSDVEIDAMMSSNLCRCGTYLRIRRAIHRAARELERHENKHKYIYK